MAEVTKVELEFGELKGTLKSVQVDYTLVFSPEDAGVTFKITVALFEVTDLPISLFPQKPVYTFTNNNIFFLQPRPYFLITATPGEASFTVTQQAPSENLNTNPGPLGPDGVQIPAPESFVAEVVLERYSPVISSKRSEPPQTIIL